MDGQARDLAEMAGVPGDHLVSAAEGGRADQQVGGWELAPGGTEACIDFGEDAHDGKGERDDRERAEHRLDELLPARAAGRRVRPPAPVEELARTHCGNRQLLVSPSFQELGDQPRRGESMPLRMDEESGIDQESHEGRSSGDSSARTRSRSSPKPSSRRTGERARRRSRHSEARRPSTAAGAIVQRARPRRWTTKRRPASTSSRSLENERLASVAETLASKGSGRSDFFLIGLILRRALARGKPLAPSPTPTTLLRTPLQPSPTPTTLLRTPLLPLTTPTTLLRERPSAAAHSF